MEEGFVALMIAVAGAVTGIVAFMAKLKKEVQEIHVMVNSNLQEALKEVGRASVRIDQLTAALESAGIDIPIEAVGDLDGG